MAKITVPIVIDSGETVQELAQRVLDSEYKGRSLREWADRISKPRTNGDKLRAMTDEELAEVIASCDNDTDFAPDCPPPYRNERTCERPCSCVTCWIGWLKEEAAAEQCSALRGAKEGEE